MPLIVAVVYLVAPCHLAVGGLSAQRTLGHFNTLLDQVLQLMEWAANKSARTADLSVFAFH